MRHLLKNKPTYFVLYIGFILIFNAIKKIAIKAYIMPATAILSIFLTGCASVSVKNSVDPWESWNSSIFNFNDSLDTGIVKPVATAYVTTCPVICANRGE